MTVEIPQGATRPPLEAQITDGDGNAVDLSEATEVYLKMGDIVHERAEIANASDGRVRYSWNDGDTDEAGVYKAKFIVNFLDGTTLKCPTGNDFKIYIRKGI